jgi:hypothetical protein
VTRKYNAGRCFWMFTSCHFPSFKCIRTSSLKIPYDKANSFFLFNKKLALQSLKTIIFVFNKPSFIPIETSIPKVFDTQDIDYRSLKLKERKSNCIAPE